MINTTTQQTLLEKGKAHLKDELPFVIYKKPHQNHMRIILQQNNAIHESNFKEEGFVFSPFDSSMNTEVWFPYQECSYIEANITSLTPTQKSDKFKKNNTEAKQVHIHKVSSAIEKLKSGELEKVVISREEKINTAQIDPFNLFEKSIHNYPNAFCYLWYHPKVGMWLGATPESLLKVTREQFSTMALASTQNYEGTLNVSWNAKEKEEQQIVVDELVNALSEITNEIEISPRETHKAGNLLHLKTTITGKLKNHTNIKKLAKILHPTSAVCGLPKQKAFKFISQIEGYDRKYYTGFLGEFNKQETDLYVNLRCMEIHPNNQATIFVGGGITPSSNAEEEWKETEHKALIMSQLF